MKEKLILFLTSLAFFLPVAAGTNSNQEQTEESGFVVNSFLNDDIIDTIIDIPMLRPINGGTVIHVQYEGDEWTNDMIGAMNYACKLWEEVLPPCYPIRIKAMLDYKMRPDQLCKTKINTDISEKGVLILPTRCKAQEIEEFNSQRQGSSYRSSSSPLSIYGEEDDEEDEFFNYRNGFDFEITFNSSLLSEISYSLDLPEMDKYDFITLVLREIAIGLGFTHSFYYDQNRDYFTSTNKFFTPFENLMIGKNQFEVATFTNGVYTFNIPNYGNLRNCLNLIQ